ncbi:MAG: hypothetical protein AB1351_12070 [Thermoproteota archaeon]
MSFEGSTTVTRNTGGVISTSGWVDGDPNMIMYQAPVVLEPDGDITGAPQVLNAAVLEWIDVLPLGEHGTDDEDVDYVYYTFV